MKINICILGAHIWRANLLANQIHVDNIMLYSPVANELKGKRKEIFNLFFSVNIFPKKLRENENDQKEKNS